MISYRSLRPAAGAPRAAIAMAGADAYDKWLAPRLPSSSELWLFCQEAPKKVLSNATVIEIPGGMVVRRELVVEVTRPWVEAGWLRLRPVAVASVKQPPQPRFDRAPIPTDLVVFDPVVHFAADRASIPRSWLAWGGESVPGELLGSPERATLIDVRTPLPFDEARAPDVPLGRLQDRPCDLWFDAVAADALKGVLGEAICEGRSRPSPHFVDAIGCEPLDLRDEAAEAAATGYFAWLRSRDQSALAATIRCPRCALLVALREGPDSETRGSACRHPFYALAYARDVDGHGDDSTRLAASRLPQLALEYACVVDRGPHEVTRTAVVGTRLLDEYELRMARIQANALARTSAPVPSVAAGTVTGKRPAPVEPWSVVALRSPARVVVLAPRAPKQALAWGSRVGDGDVVVRTPEGPAGAKLAKNLSKHAVLSSDEFGPWILRRDIASQVFAGVAGVATRQVKLEHRGQAVEHDFVLLDVVADRPLDRERARLTTSCAARPWSSVVRALITARVLARPDDEAVMARVSEFPSLLVASPALVRRFAEAGLAVTVVKEPHEHLRPAPVFALWDEGPEYPAADDGAAVAALRAALAGEPLDRAACVGSAWPAYALAGMVDGEPRADTRAGALGHPHTATLYARFVDGAPRDDTREAAALTGPTAQFYVSYVDRCLHPSTRNKLLACGWRESDLQTLLPLGS